MRNFGYDATSVHSSVRPYRLSGWRLGGKTASADGSVWAIFLSGKSRGSVAFGKPNFSGEKSYYLPVVTSNGKEHGRRGDKI